MRIEVMNPLDIIPIEAPHKPETVKSLIKLYENPEMEDALDKIIPFAFVHRMRNGDIYTMDGHHRIGVAHMYGKGVNAIFINTFRDLRDAFVLRDLQFIPHFELGFPEETLPRLSSELPSCRPHAIVRGVRSYDDYAQQLREGKFWTYSQEEICDMFRKIEEIQVREIREFYGK